MTERVVAAEAAARGLTAAGAPAEADLLPDATARLEIGSVAAAVLADPLARALFAAVTARVAVTDDAVADYHARNPLRFAAPCPGQHGWRAPAAAAPPLDQVRRAITEHLLGAARRRAFRVWLDARRNALVVLAPAMSTPATRANPTTPAGTDAHPLPRHRRHQDRRGPGRPGRHVGAHRPTSHPGVWRSRTGLGRGRRDDRRRARRGGGAVGGVGIASAGPIDLHSGRVSPINIGSWGGFPLRDRVAAAVPGFRCGWG